MRDITNIKDDIEKRLSKKCCNLDDISLCTKGDKCTCKIAAETQAYLMSIIPAPYFKFTIHDFTGISKDGQLLVNDKVIIPAREKIINYCWKGLDIKKIQGLTSTEMDKYSCISERRINGNNVVIFDDSSLSVKSKNPRGKTMCAALIMKEAIKNRINDEDSFTQTYEWVSYPILENMIIKKEDVVVNELQSTDWLVIDDITYSEQRWKKQIIDPFLLERFNDGLPTILVFRFNIAQYNSEDALGVSMSKIIRNSKTFIISLAT